MCWVALDRAARLAGIRDDEEREARWSTAAEEVRADILAHGVSEAGVLRQHYGTDALDASTLLAALFGFLPGTDPVLRATVDAIESDLTEHGFVLRYRTEETDDGLTGREGTFLICSFWLVSALAHVGEMRRARNLMDRLVRIQSPLGLYAEEYDTERARHLGNFPQAFSHLALIQAAGRLVLAERLVCAGLSGSALLGSSSGAGVRPTPVGEPRSTGSSCDTGSPLGTIVSAEPIGVGPVGTRTLVLRAAAVPPATSTAATVSAAMPPVLFTPPR